MKHVLDQLHLIGKLTIDIVGGLITYAILVGVWLVAHKITHYAEEVLGQTGPGMVLQVTDYALVALEAVIFFSYICLTGARYLKELHHVLDKETRRLEAER
ncbi:hypothetical protein [Sinorhizobium fredii]|uniref:hypothetical protein n=1 Tax=Rhizobium fredii TaxID=380 RepID=UPI003519919C